MFSNLKRKKFRKSWARLIQKVYHVNPLICTKCSGQMKIISFIEDEAVIKTILKHLKLWMPDNHDPPYTPKLLSEAFQQVEMFTEQSITSWYEKSANDKELLPKMPYEDEYSPLTSYDD